MSLQKSLILTLTLYYVFVITSVVLEKRLYSEITTTRLALTQFVVTNRGRLSVCSLEGASKEMRTGHCQLIEEWKAMYDGSRGFSELVQFSCEVRWSFSDLRVRYFVESWATTIFHDWISITFQRKVVSKFSISFPY